MIDRRLRDPKTPPKFASNDPPKVYLNREWKFRPELVKASEVPSTYQWKGRQYVVIAAGGAGKLRTKAGDEFVVFALPE